MFSSLRSLGHEQRELELHQDLSLDHRLYLEHSERTPPINKKHACWEERCSNIFEENILKIFKERGKRTHKKALNMRMTNL